MNNWPTLKILGLLALISLVLAGSLLLYDYLRIYHKFPSQTFISVIDVSGLTQREAVLKLRKVPLGLLYSPSITLQAGDVIYSFPPEKLGIFVLAKETVRRAFSKAHKPNYFEDVKHRMKTTYLCSPVVLGLDEGELKALLEVIANNVLVPSREASIVFYEKGGGYHISSETIGRELNVNKSLIRIKESISRMDNPITLAVEPLNPRILEKTLRQNPPIYRLAGYVTYFGKHDSANRIHNIQLISSLIGGSLLMPGDVFSLTEKIGTFSTDRGFKEAFVIYNGELVPELGGGTCQVGTTLFNAALLSDLKVVQRRNHSFYFNIYPLGRDATIYPGQSDLKIENDSGYPAIIKTAVTDKSLTVRIYGTPSEIKVKFSTPEVFGKDVLGNFSPMTIEAVLAQDIPFKTAVKRMVFDRARNLIKQDTIYSSYKLYGDKENVPIKRPEPEDAKDD